jgi:hypothetical protein
VFSSEVVSLVADGRARQIADGAIERWNASGELEGDMFSLLVTVAVLRRDRRWTSGGADEVFLLSLIHQVLDAIWDRLDEEARNKGV